MSARIIPLPNCDFQLVAIPWNWFQIIFKMEWTKIWSTVLFPRSNNSILGRFWVKTENHERNISRKCPKKSKNGQKWWIRINLRFINFRMDDCGRKLYDSKNSENRLESAFHYTRKWIEKEKFVKSFGIMRDQKVRRIMGNYGEPSGNICSDLLIEPQVTSLGHDLKWPHDEHTHTHSADCTWTYHDQNWTKRPSIMDHLRLDIFKSFLPPKTYLCTVLELLPPPTTAVTIFHRGLPVPYGPYDHNFRMRKWLIYHCHPRKSALIIIFPI